jgi:hypothetical protein
VLDDSEPDDDPDATKKKGQVCQANFYGGE